MPHRIAPCSHTALHRTAHCQLRAAPLACHTAPHQNRRRTAAPRRTRDVPAKVEGHARATLESMGGNWKRGKGMLDVAAWRVGRKADFSWLLKDTRGMPPT